MDSLILKFILAHTADLKPSDFVIIAIFILAITYAVWRLIDWIYRRRIETQDAVIDLKEREIGSYQNLYNNMLNEKNQLDGQVKRLQSDLSTIQQRSAFEKDQFAFTFAALLKNTQRLTTAFWIATSIAIILAFMDTTRKMLQSMYKEFEKRLPNAPPSSEQWKRLDRIAVKMHEAVSALGRVLEKPTHLIEGEITIPRLLEEFEGAASKRLRLRASSFWHSREFQSDWRKGRLA